MKIDKLSSKLYYSPETLEMVEYFHKLPKLIDLEEYGLLLVKVIMNHQEKYRYVNKIFLNSNYLYLDTVKGLKHENTNHKAKKVRI